MCQQGKYQKVRNEVWKFWWRMTVTVRGTFNGAGYGLKECMSHHLSQSNLCRRSEVQAVRLKW